MRPGDKMYIDRSPRRVKFSESGTTDLLIGYSNNLQQPVAGGSRKLLSRTTGSHTIGSVTESNVTIDNHGVATPLSLDLVSKVS